MPQQSAGLVMVRRRDATLEVLLVHPGGPLWAKKDDGAWTIPKGLVEAGEEPLAAAQREFAEETGFPATGPFHPLGEIRQKSGKVVHAWAFLGDCDPVALRSNSFEMEWPPRSGRKVSFPEVDRAAFFPLAAAARKILPSQWPLVAKVSDCFPSPSQDPRGAR